MRILVTGAAGFIGRHLAADLHDAGHVVATTDCKHGAGDDSDLTNADDCYRLLGEYTPDVVVHLAAQVGRLFGEDDVAHTIASNAIATANLARAVGESGCRMLYVSTSEVYGDQGERVCRESEALAMPHNLYGLTKRWGEEACRLYCPEGLQIVRLSMPYGTGVAPGRGRAALNNVLWQAHTRQRIPIHRGAERSWCWVGDTVAGIRIVLERGEQLPRPTYDVSLFGHTEKRTMLGGDAGWGIYNVGRDDDAVSMLALAHSACDMTGCPRGLVDVVEPPNMQTVVKRLSTDKLRALGWAPTVELEEGMSRVLSWVSHFDRHGVRNPRKAKV